MSSKPATRHRSASPSCTWKRAQCTPSKLEILRTLTTMTDRGGGAWRGETPIPRTGGRALVDRSESGSWRAKLPAGLVDADAQEAERLMNVVFGQRHYFLVDV